MPRAIQRSRGTGPRATEKRHVTVGRGPSPCLAQSNDRGGQAPALRKKRLPHRRARACPSPCWDRGGQAPALREKTACVTVGRGPVPRQRFAVRPPHPCRSGSPDPDPFVIRRSQTTGSKTSPLDDGDRGGQAPALRKKRPPHRRARACPSPCWDRGGQAPALR